ncbi:MAG: hypothetical protein JW765_13705 [Deltaproteobacteria bacterium]|nr:hypothetical protein [Candidatus Zymogenaceae bacterium]
MPEVKQPDMSCFPYRRKKFYAILTIPLFILLIAVFIYLWSFSFVLSIIYLSFYLLICLFQAYCCAYQECPYIGGFCPAVSGIMPSSLLAGLLYGKKMSRKSKVLFNLNAAIAFTALVAFILLPIYWIAKLGILHVIGYVIFYLGYYLVFLLTICPACAIRETCPGGKLQGLVLGKRRTAAS